MTTDHIGVSEVTIKPKSVSLGLLRVKMHHSVRFRLSERSDITNSVNDLTSSSSYHAALIISNFSLLHQE